MVDHHLHFLENFLENPEAPFADKLDFLRSYLEKTIQNGVSILGFSEHAYLFHEAKSINFNDFQEKKCKFSLEEYVGLMTELKKEFPDIIIGLEVDYKPEKENDIKKQLKEWIEKYNFDFFIGSVHWIDGLPVDLSKEEYGRLKEEKDIYKEYYGLMKQLVESSLFQIIGHLDLIKIFNTVSENSKREDLVLSLLPLTKEHNLAVEINTNGFNKPIGEQYPSENIIRALKKYGINITFSSDAHKPERVGEYFDKMKEMTKRIGYDKLVYLKNRKEIHLNL